MFSFVKLGYLVVTINEEKEENTLKKGLETVGFEKQATAGKINFVRPFGNSSEVIVLWRRSHTVGSYVEHTDGTRDKVDISLDLIPLLLEDIKKLDW